MVAMRRAATAFLLTGAALLAGCGGSDESASQTSEPTPAATEATPAAAEATPAESEVRVAMKDFKFVPADVTVEQGQTITWVNEDTAQHDAVAPDGDGPKSKLFNQGESYSWTAEKAGRIPYVCTVHPGMEGTITVR